MTPEGYTPDQTQLTSGSLDISSNIPKIVYHIPKEGPPCHVRLKANFSVCIAISVHSNYHLGTGYVPAGFFL